MDPVGPLIPAHYKSEPITTGDVAIASAVFGLTLIFAGISVWLALEQTRNARAPVKSPYIWMIWLELVVSLAMAVECYCHILKLIPPSFAFFFTILTWWCIQVQLLLQIIINRVRVISVNKDRAKIIMIVTAVVVTLINISVFNIWIPARLQINKQYIHINEIWDRIEKAIYLIMDAVLNAYFIKSVKRNLVENGLQKYNGLLKFNVRIIFVSLLMDVMIIAAMSIPNSFVYIQFHPLAYLVKLAIEMTMARLIRKIAISSAKRNNNNTAASRGAHNEFKSSEGVSTSTGPGIGGGVSGTFALATIDHEGGKYTRFDYEGKGIKRTQEVTVEIVDNEEGMMDGRQHGNQVSAGGPLAGANSRREPHAMIVETRSPSTTGSKDDQGSARSASQDLDADEVPLGYKNWKSGLGYGQK